MYVLYNTDYISNLMDVVESMCSVNGVKAREALNLPRRLHIPPPLLQSTSKLLKHVTI